MVELQIGQLFICKDIILLQVRTKGTREATHCFALQEENNTYHHLHQVQQCVPIKTKKSHDV